MGITRHAEPDDKRLSLAGVEAALCAIRDTAAAILASKRVLATEAIVFDASGIITRDYGVPYRSVAITRGSQGSQAVTVTAAAAEATAPVAGTGVAVIPPGVSTVVNLAGRNLTLYGKTGDTVTITVFAGPQPPAWGWA